MLRTDHRGLATDPRLRIPDHSSLVMNREDVQAWSASHLSVPYFALHHHQSPVISHQSSVIAHQSSLATDREAAQASGHGGLLTGRGSLYILITVMADSPPSSSLVTLWVGRVSRGGSGMCDAELCHVLERQDPLTSSRCPCACRPVYVPHVGNGWSGAERGVA